MKFLLRPLILSFFMLCLPVFAKPNVGYITLPTEQPTSKQEIEVQEFFWYGCLHCFSLDPKLSAWASKLPKDVVLVRASPVFGASWQPLSTLFYTLKSMGFLDRLHPLIFNALHVDRKNLNSDSVLSDFLTKNGVDYKTYRETSQSFAVQAAQKRDTHLAMAYKLDAVPNFVVAGKYVTSVQLSGGESQLFVVLDSLINQVRASRTGAAKK